MKIAICLSGHIRTWKKCYESWKLIWENIPNCEVDFFIHTWNENYSRINLANTQLSKIDKKEIDELISIINPKEFIIETPKKILHLNGPSSLRVEKYLSQYYGVMKCARLKKNYEIKNDFIYDVVIRSRFDLYFKESILNNDFIELNYKTIYGFHYVYNWDARSFRFGDIFFYSDSLSYDVVSDYYYGSQFLPKYWPIDEIPPPEYDWHYYVKSNGMQLNINHWDIEIIRDV